MSFDKACKAQVGSVAAAAEAAAELRRKGFDVLAHEDLRSAWESLANDAAAAVDERADAVAELRARDYDGYHLYPYQAEGVAWLRERRAACLFDQMGLGKTPQALVAAPNDRLAIICPKLAMHNWAREIQRWRPELRATLLSGRNGWRWPEEGEAVIINWDILPQLPASPPGAVSAIADEAHYAKSYKAKRTKRWRAVARAALLGDGTCYQLTGTPMLNQPGELWTVLGNLGLATEAFGSFGRYCKLFNAFKGRFGLVWGKAEPDVPRLLRKVSLYRRRDEVLPDLPTKVYEDVLVDIDDATREALDEMARQLAEAGVDVDAMVEDVMAAKREAESTREGGILFEQYSRVRERLATAKVDAMLEMVAEYEAQDEPLVVFSRHRSPIDTLGEREGWEAITGSTSTADRQRIVDEFQAGRLRGIALTIQAGGTAITLTAAHHVLFVDLDWTPALNEQAEDRVCRIGQDRGVIVKRLVADHAMDQSVTKLLSAKQTAIQAAVGLSAVEAPCDTQERVAVYEAAIESLSAADAEAAPQSGRRGPSTAQEEWAAQALVTLAALDPDKARTLNTVGFNRLDGRFGHSLAQQVVAGLTPKQWRAAVRLCAKYHRQVGRCPR